MELEEEEGGSGVRGRELHMEAARRAIASPRRYEISRIKTHSEAKAVEILTSLSFGFRPRCSLACVCGSRHGERKMTEVFAVAWARNN